MNKVAALVRAWLVLDFFGDARRAGKGHASSLTTVIFAQSFFALAFAALLYPETPPTPFAAANLSLSTLLLAIGALGDEGRPARRGADEVLCRTAPLTALARTAARALHTAFAIGLVTVGMALPPAILLAFLTGSWFAVPLYVLAALACSAMAALALDLVARLAAAIAGAGRAALLLGTLKAALYGGGLVLFARSLPHLDEGADALPIGRAALAAWPPYHAARWLAAPAAEAWRLLAIVVAAAAALLATAALPDDGDRTERRRRRAGPLLALLRRITPPGPGRAVAEFTAIGMWRSPGFRARALPLLGMPAAMVFLASKATAPGSAPPLVAPALLLQLPAVYLPFLVAFLPHADHPGAGWLFAHAPTLSAARITDAVWRALVSHVLAPVLALATAALVLRDPAQASDTLAAAVFAFALAVAAARAAVRPLDAVPFTVASEAEAGPDLGGLLPLALGLGAAGFAFGGWLPPALRWPVALAAAALAAHALLRRRSIAAALAPATAQDEDAGTIAAADATVVAAAADGGPTLGIDAAPTDAATGLRRELRAIAALYVLTSLLPLAVGALFAP